VVDLPYPTSTTQVNALDQNGAEYCCASGGLELHLRLVFRLHMRKTLLFAPPSRVIHRAARALETAHVILVTAKKPLDLSTAAMVVGYQVFVEFGASVGHGLPLQRHSGVEAALDTLQIELLHSEKLGIDGGGHFGG
jgi:hypothetical protein